MFCMFLFFISSKNLRQLILKSIATIANKLRQRIAKLANKLRQTYQGVKVAQPIAVSVVRHRYLPQRVRKSLRETSRRLSLLEIRHSTIRGSSIIQSIIQKQFISLIIISLNLNVKNFTLELQIKCFNPNTVQKKNVFQSFECFSERLPKKSVHFPELMLLAVTFLQ